MEQALCLEINNRIYGLNNRVIDVGRSPQRTIHLNDKSVSSMHATIEFMDNKFCIRDENSTNGSFLNGKKLSPGANKPIQEGDQLKFGHIQGEVLLFLIE